MLTVKMSQTDGQNAVISNNGGTVNIYGGTLEGGYQTAVYGRAIYQNLGTLNVYDGTLIGCSTDSTYVGTHAV